MLSAVVICKFGVWNRLGTHRFVHTTSALWAEPVKKRQRVDPSVLQNRIERKKLKLQREIQDMLKVTNRPKPVEELSLDFQTAKQIGKHRRKPVAVEMEEQERRALLAKEYARFKYFQFRNEMRRINYMVFHQERALKELRLESEELYLAAIQPSDNLLPFVRRGPTDTPPIQNYTPPDGDYIDTTKTYEL